MDPSPPPAAGTGEPLASICSQGHSGDDPLGIHSAAARAGNFALYSQREKCPGHSVHLTSCTSNLVKAHCTSQLATLQIHVLWEISREGTRDTGQSFREAERYHTEPVSPSAVREGSSKCSVSSLGPAPDILLALGQQLLIWEAALPARPCSWRRPQAPAGTSTPEPTL